MAGVRSLVAAPFAVLLLSTPAFAAEESLGAQLGLQWVAPFAGILLSIALFPLLAPRFWHHHFGKVALFWALLFLIPFGFVHGWGEAGEEVLHVYVIEFIPFIVLLWALYTVAGGIRLKGRLRGTPVVNAGLLLIGTVLASWMGTTGAAMLMIRPVIRANAWRKHKTHVVIFFIFMVANIGGSLTPLGDPPLFLGFLHGVEFFWTTTHLLLPMFLCVGLLLVVFFLMDRILYARENPQGPPDDGSNETLGLEGTFNFLFLGGIVAAILFSGAFAKAHPYWDASALQEGSVHLEEAREHVTAAEEHLKAAPEEERTERVRELLEARIELNEIREHAEHQAVKGWHLTSHVTWPYINMIREGLLILMGILSLWFTSSELRRKNDFTWFPIVEVAKLFAGIFITIIPAIAILRAGPDGALSHVVMGVTAPDGDPINTAYFWATGVLSSFLDNAPTYLVFFNTAGGNAEWLMGPGHNTLLAVSAGAVFMGANTYIGNAPNFMVRSIAEEAQVPMPSFFGYLLKWSLPILIPTFALVTLAFFL